MKYKRDAHVALQVVENYALIEEKRPVQFIHDGRPKKVLSVRIYIGSFDQRRKMPVGVSCVLAPGWEGVN